MNRLEQQLEFIKEIDKLKLVLRRCLLINGERYENTAEHSWHLAIMALVLAEYYKYKNLDMLRVIKLAIIHDLAEIYAGDTYCYDENASMDQEQRECASLKRLLALLPKDQQEEYSSLWYEFEKATTHEAKFARVVDRLSPFMLNFFSGGSSWKKHEVKVSQVYKRMSEIKDSCPEIWDYVERLLQEAVKNQWIIDDIKA